MGRPKHLIEIDGETLIERLVRTLKPFVRRVYISGGGRLPASLRKLPRLRDPAGVNGPIAGLCAAFRQHPRSAWLLCACDMPRVNSAAVRWLVDQRAAGAFAVIPRVGPRDLEPLFAVYEPQSKAAVRRLADENAGPRRLAEARCRRPRVPARLVAAWTNVNFASELAGL